MIFNHKKMKPKNFLHDKKIKYFYENFHVLTHNNAYNKMIFITFYKKLISNYVWMSKLLLNIKIEVNINKNGYL